MNMTGKQIVVLPVVALLLLAISYAQETVKESPETTSVNDIRQVDFKNFTFKRPECEKETDAIQLSNGKHVRADGAQSWLMRITYGDLTGNGIEEAIVLLRGQNTRISRTLDEVFIYTLKDGKVVPLAHFDGGRRGDYILSVASLGSNFKVEGGLLILDQAILREGEYVPTHYYTIKYRWNGVQMAEVERTALKLLPEGMREEG
jgi:hypothetical protein